ncbi:MAG: hypothetical protein IBJ03_13905 [Gemmatimonadaceae bacterium]|nr:hypothetical protein [Gemmatimonadaceae bacterium]
MRQRLVRTLFAALALCALMSPVSLMAQAPRIQAGSVVRPDTVEVGDPFVFVVTVAVPAGAKVEWPRIEDSTAVVNMRGPVRVIDEGTKGSTRRERAEYTLSAWNVGRLPLGLNDAIVRAGGTTLRVPLGEAQIFVRSVLPGDSTLHVPKPARDLFERVVPWWERWWPAALVLALLGLLAWLWRKLRKRKPAVAAAPFDPYGRALHEFSRLEQLKLADAGEAGRWAALVLDVVRLYLRERVEEATLALTSSEVLEALESMPDIPHDRLHSLMVDVDSIKFAARSVSAERARKLATDARDIVESVEHNIQARRAAEREARAAADRAVERDRLAAEDAARKASRQPKSGRRGPPAGVG